MNPTYPETREAIERWHQGKINIFDEMARLEQERDYYKDQYHKLVLEQRDKSNK